ncbi:HAD family hydrolase [Paractinoplanes maris]|uniref:HAD family hydrolase n=1 Tax=Paractinoplanes maris TaxID=1734446 RepID=UPI00201FF1B9|nr:HAD family hydrolase [Actinoplanes maris]
MTEPLASWRDTPARQRIVEFVTVAVAGIPPAERVAVFDNDGTLWCEKPLPVQAGFLLRRVGELAANDPALRAKQPFKAVAENDHAWLSGAITKHYEGDDGDLREMAAGLLQAYDGTAVDEFAELARDFLVKGENPALHRPWLDTAYRPMTELLTYLAANGFTCYIATGGGRDFMRTVSEELYGITPDRVIGSSVALEYRDGTIRHTARLDVFDDGLAKPVRIWSRIGRHPILVAGNANGDIPMLRAAGGGRRDPLRLLIVHDDADREFAYTQGADDAISVAETEDWTKVSMAADWARIF